VGKQFQDHADAQKRAGLLAESLSRHDTNALVVAKSYLWEDHDVCCETFFKLIMAKWDAADELANDFLLHGPNEGGCKAWAVNVISGQDRFSNTILRIASDYSPGNLPVVEAAVPSVGKMHTTAADAFLVDVAVNCPDAPIRDQALRWLQNRNKALYSETVLKLGNDKEFMERYPRR
jgi:hypothetical protein